MYSKPQKNENEPNSRSAPPRPPKSPSLLRREFAHQHASDDPFPPPRPPKPGRYRSEPTEISFNFNFNNNKSNDVVKYSNFAKCEELRQKTQAVKNARLKKRTSEQELEALMKETRDVLRLVSPDKCK